MHVRHLDSSYVKYVDISHAAYLMYDNMNFTYFLVRELGVKGTSVVIMREGLSFHFSHTV